MGSGATAGRYGPLRFGGPARWRPSEPPCAHFLVVCALGVLSIYNVGWGATLLPRVDPRYNMRYCYDGLVGPCGFVSRDYPAFFEAIPPRPSSVSPLYRWVGFLPVGFSYLQSEGMGFHELGACF